MGFRPDRPGQRKRLGAFQAVLLAYDFPGITRISLDESALSVLLPAEIRLHADSLRYDVFLLLFSPCAFWLFPADFNRLICPWGGSGAVRFFPHIEKAEGGESRNDRFLPHNFAGSTLYRLHFRAAAPAAMA